MNQANKYAVGDSADGPIMCFVSHKEKLADVRQMYPDKVVAKAAAFDTQETKRFKGGVLVDNDDDPLDEVVSTLMVTDIRNSKEQEPVEAFGVLFDFAKHDQDRMNETIDNWDYLTVPYWKAADNSHYLLNDDGGTTGLEKLIALRAELRKNRAIRFNQVFMQAEVLKSQSVITKRDLDQIGWL